MLSARNELFAVGAVIVALAFFPSVLSPLRDLLSTSVGKAAALAGLVYVHQKVSCSLALVLVVAYVRLSTSTWEGVDDTLSKPSTPMMKPPTPTEQPAGPASTSMPPPSSVASRFPPTTPTAPPNAYAPSPPPMAGVQPATSTSSAPAAH